MATLKWSEALALGLPTMDDTHREFVDLLALVEGADNDTLAWHWSTLINHTHDHFGREDAWMRSTRFSSTNCHSVQHQVVLTVMREGLVSARAGDHITVRRMAKELATWFVQHAQTMDAALALHLRRVGYDPVTGVVSMPDALPRTVTDGCGSAGCSDRDAQAPVLAPA